MTKPANHAQRMFALHLHHAAMDTIKAARAIGLTITVDSHRRAGITKLIWWKDGFFCELPLTEEALVDLWQTEQLPWLVEVFQAQLTRYADAYERDHPGVKIPRE